MMVSSMASGSAGGPATPTQSFKLDYAAFFSRLKIKWGLLLWIENICCCATRFILQVMQNQFGTVVLITIVYHHLFDKGEIPNPVDFLLFSPLF